ncbi:MAG: EF-hand domain-containing protein [Brevundimonas sp.]
MQTKFLSSALVAALTLGVAGFASAQAPGGDRFALADLDGDQRLSISEFQAARDTVFRRLDTNGDARIAFSELRALADGRRERGRSRGRGREALARLREIDRNGDRAIDLVEYRALGQRRFESVDLNRDGWLRIEEFQALREEFLAQR